MACTYEMDTFKVMYSMLYMIVLQTFLPHGNIMQDGRNTTNTNQIYSSIICKCMHDK